MRQRDLAASRYRQQFSDIPRLQAGEKGPSRREQGRRRLHHTPRHAACRDAACPDGDVGAGDAVGQSQLHYGGGDRGRIPATERRSGSLPHKLLYFSYFVLDTYTIFA